MNIVKLTFYYQLLIYIFETELAVRAFLNLCVFPTEELITMYIHLFITKLNSKHRLNEKSKIKKNYLYRNMA